MSGPQQPPGYGQPPGYVPPGYGPPPGYGQPPGYVPPPGYGYGVPPPPRGSRLGPTIIIAVLVGVVLAVVLAAGLIILLTQPLPPEPDCLPSQPCAPKQTLPPIADRSPLPTPGATATGVPTSLPSPSTSPGPTTPGATDPPASPAPTIGPQPTPGSDSPPATSGERWTSATLGYSFEFDPEVFELLSEDGDTAVFGGTFFDAQVVVEATDATTSPAEMITRQLYIVDQRIIARAPDTDEYDALLGPSIGYIRGEGAVFGGTLLGRDGTPIAPAGVVVLSSTDGRITVAVVLLVATPDLLLGSETHFHALRNAADDFLKTFNWGGT